VPHGLQHLEMTIDESAAIVAAARRRFRLHNRGRAFVEEEVAQVLAASARQPIAPEDLWPQIRRHPIVVEALERMWPLLSAAELLHDLLGSRALLRLAGGRHLDDEAVELL